MKQFPYRADVNGLRAIAVLAVVFYHANLPGFSGGFVGVDVFLVISGYLITSIIDQKIHDKKFSISKFYQRRIRRIFPALFAVVFVSFLTAAVLFLPVDFADFGKSVVATSLFAANFHFWLDVDYFAGPATTKPLLHMWSLAVEEQFYIFFPLLLTLIAGLARSRRLWLFVFLLVISLVASEVAVAQSSGAAFYLTPYRAWELLLGAILAPSLNLPRPQIRLVREVIAIIGMLAITWSIYFLSEAQGFPGLAALPATLGAAMIIWTDGKRKTLISRLLSLRPLVFVGLISYSLYLIHWPALVFSRYYNITPMGNEQIAIVLIASLFLAAFSWKFIEQPFRKQIKSRRIIIASAVSVLLISVSVGLIAFLTNGLASRFSTDRRAYAEMTNKANFFPIYDRGHCFLDYHQQVSDYPWQECVPLIQNDTNPIRVLLWGDSYAAHLFPGLTANLSGSNATVFQYTATSCWPMDFGDERCDAINHAMESNLERMAGADIVVISVRWIFLGPGGNDEYVERIQSAIGRAKNIANRVILFGQTPSYEYSLSLYGFLHKAEIDGNESYLQALDHRSLNDFLRITAEQSGAEFVDPYSPNCEETTCLAYVNGEPLHWDPGHMTAIGSEYYTDELAQLILSE